MPGHGIFLPYLLVSKQHLYHPEVDTNQGTAMDSVTCLQLSSNYLCLHEDLSERHGSDTE